MRRPHSLGSLLATYKRRFTEVHKHVVVVVLFPRVNGIEDSGEGAGEASFETDTDTTSRGG